VSKTLERMSVFIIKTDCKSNYAVRATGDF